MSDIKDLVKRLAAIAEEADYMGLVWDDKEQRWVADTKIGEYRYASANFGDPVEALEKLADRVERGVIT